MSNTTITSIAEKLLQLGFQPDVPPASDEGTIRTIGSWKICTSVADSSVFVDAFHVASNECWSKLVLEPEAKYWDTVQSAIQAVSEEVFQ